jgi:hypothetical protein
MQFVQRDKIFVSQHAVEQFQQRIAAMPAAKARAFIRAGIRVAENVKLLPDGKTLRIRTRRPFPFEFRAYCVFDEERSCFVVTTIVRGASNVTRQHKRKMAGENVSTIED